MEKGIPEATPQQAEVIAEQAKQFTDKLMEVIKEGGERAVQEFYSGLVNVFTSRGDKEI